MANSVQVQVHDGDGVDQKLHRVIYYVTAYSHMEWHECDDWICMARFRYVDLDTMEQFRRIKRRIEQDKLTKERFYGTWCEFIFTVKHTKWKVPPDKLVCALVDVRLIEPPDKDKPTWHAQGIAGHVEWEYG